MLDTSKKKKTLYMMIIYLIPFYIVWFLYTVFLAPVLDRMPLAIEVFISNLCKIICWTFPVILLLMSVFKRNPIRYLKLDKNVLKGIVAGAVSGGIIIVSILLRRIAFSGDVHINFLFGINTWLGGVLLIGITEEVVFRGYILQKFKEIVSFNRANAITSVLFVIIHFPKWFVDGDLFSYKFFVNSALFLLIFSYMQGVMLKKTGSIWSCFIFHAANNFAMFAFTA